MAAVLLVVGGMLAAAQPAQDDPEFRLEVRRLLRGLDAAQLADREAAQQRLIELGPRVLEVLPPPDERMSAEARQRLARIVEQLQQQEAQRAAQAARITLHGEKRLSEVLAALEKQSGNRLVDDRQRFGGVPRDPVLAVHFDKVPFWEALDQVLDEAGLSIEPYGGRDELHLVPRIAGDPPRKGRAAYCGPFRIEPIAVVARRDLRHGLGDMLRVELELTWEPRLRPIALKQPLGKIKAADARARRLEVLDPAAELETPTVNTPQLEIFVPFKLPPRDAAEIATLEGKLLAILPGREQTFRFGNLLEARNVEQRAAGVSVILERVVQNNQLWQVRVQVRFDDAGQALESHRGWILQNEAYLESADGEILEYDALETTQQTADSIGLAYGFVLDEPPKNCTFVYKTPGAIITATLNYRLEHIPLP